MPDIDKLLKRRKMIEVPYHYLLDFLRVAGQGTQNIALPAIKIDPGTSVTDVHYDPVRNVFLVKCINAKWPVVDCSMMAERITFETIEVYVKKRE